MDYNYNFKLQEKDSKSSIMTNFTPKMRSSLVQAIKNAYKWVSIWEKDPNNKVLTTYRSKYIRGNAIMTAVDYYIIEEIKLGNLNLNYNFEYTKNKSYPFLVLSNDEKTFKLTVNQVASIKSLPSFAVNREERINSYYSNLFLSEEDIEKELTAEIFQLTHGYQTSEPGFIILGIPDQNRSWFDFVNILQEPLIVRNDIKLTTSKVEAKVPNLSEMQESMNELINNE